MENVLHHMSMKLEIDVLIRNILGKLLCSIQDIEAKISLSATHASHTAILEEKYYFQVNMVAARY
jgi:hypothetical protein